MLRFLKRRIRMRRLSIHLQKWPVVVACWRAAKGVLSFNLSLIYFLLYHVNCKLKILKAGLEAIRGITPSIHNIFVYSWLLFVKILTWQQEGDWMTQPAVTPGGASTTTSSAQDGIPARHWQHPPQHLKSLTTRITSWPRLSLTCITKLRWGPQHWRMQESDSSAAK